MSTTNAPDTRRKGDRLDDIFAELDPINDEIRSIMFTPTGRLRLRLNEKQQARLDELNPRADALAKEACRIVAE